MAAKRKPPPEWWVFGYLAQYQRRALFRELGVVGLSSDDICAAAGRAAERLPNLEYRRLSKAWAVRQLRARKLER